MFTKLLFDILADPAIAPYYNMAMSYAMQYKLYVMIAAALMVLLIGFYGQRLFGLVRWSALFAVGFVLGAGMLTPMLRVYAPSANALLIGIFCGLVVAVLSRFAYNAVIIAIVGFDVFNICFNALLFPILETYTKGDAVMSAGVALACIVLAFMLRKYAEMLVTASIVGFALPIVINRFVFDFAVYVPIEPVYTVLIAGVILTAIMFGWQFKHRVRYN